jgi:UDP-2-acetamido-2-deoxy-ribo-hexuluronate aminotransferase
VIPFVDLKAQFRAIEDDVRSRIDAVLEHQRFIMGPEVAELEAALGERAGCQHVVGLSSGTDALLVALMAAEIGPGDAVFLPAFTFTATPEAVLMTGATPVFVDVDARTFNVTAEALEAGVQQVLAEGQLRPRVVMAVDLFGLPADYAGLRTIAVQHDLLVLGDAAQSFGAQTSGTAVGALADITATSFFPAKPLGGYGDGGALFTNDADIAHRSRSIRAHGKGEGKYDIVRIGLNARLDTMQAAILLAKLSVFGVELEAREKLAVHYDEQLGDLVTIPYRTNESSSAWAQYTIQVDQREAVAAGLKEKGIPSAVYYPLPMHMQPAYSAYGNGEGSLPVSESLCQRVLSLPMHPYMDDATADQVCAGVREVVQQLA